MDRHSDSVMFYMYVFNVAVLTKMDRLSYTLQLMGTEFLTKPSQSSLKWTGSPTMNENGEQNLMDRRSPH